MTREVSSSRTNRSRANAARILLLGSGIVFVLLALLYGLLYDQLSAALSDPSSPPSDIASQKVASARLNLLLAGLILIAISELVRRIPRLHALMSRPLATNILLCALTLSVPLSILEFSLRPLIVADKKTSIFVADDELGWRLRPNAEDVWGGVNVKINGKGLRGPELDYTKPSNVGRILYLGDSVTFGYLLESYRQTFPYIIEEILGGQLTHQIETINAGIGGYSPWQEYIYLSREGIKYSPDLVVVSFVLNDVTEKFELVRFGGTGQGFQLSQAATELERLSRKSGLVYLAKKISTRIKFGREVQKGAMEREALNVKLLLDPPVRPDIKTAWEITLENLGKIFDFCRDRHIPVILVLFPFSYQFPDVNADFVPQQIVSGFAADKDVPVIDLLPILDGKLKEQGLKPDDYFLDYDHLSPLGSETVAEIIAQFIQERELLIH